MAVKISKGENPFPGLPFFQPPLYPYFLGLLYILFGRSIGLVRFLQMLLGVANVALTYLLGRRLFGPRVGFWAGVVFSLYGTMLFFEGELLAPVVIVFLNLLLSVSLLRTLERPSPGRAFLTGVLLGASAITMSVILPFAVVILVYGLRHFRRMETPPDFRRQLLLGFCFLLGAGAVIAPVSIRNASEGHDAVLISSNGGINFYIGTGKDFDQKVGIRPGYQWQALGREPIKAGFIKPSEQSAYFKRKAWTFIKNDPRGYAGILLKKLYLYANGNEILRNQEIYPFRKYSSILSALVWKHGLAFPYGLLFPLACVGVAAALARREKRAGLFALFMASHIAVIILFFVAARYRMNILPFLVIFAVYAVGALFGLLRAKKWGKAALSVAGLAALLVLSNWNTGPMQEIWNADAYYNLGVKYMEENRPEAKAMYEKAIDLIPDYPEANGNLGVMLVQEGDLKKGRVCFDVVLRQYPDDIEANIDLGLILFKEGNTEGARKQFLKVLALDPKNEIARNNLDVLERGPAPGRGPMPGPGSMPGREPSPGPGPAPGPEPMPGMPPGGLTRIEELKFQLQLEPDNPALLTNLGASYLAAEDYAHALEPLQKAVRLAPNLTQARNNLGIALANLGKRAEARREFDKVLELDPNNKSAKENIKMLETGR
jgi:Flp pilus assembly protein TadD